MKITRPIKRYVPGKAINKLHLALEQSQSTLEKERFYFFLDLITRVPSWNKDLLDEYRGYIPLEAKTLKSMMGGSYKAYIDFLKQNNIVISDNWYITKSKGKEKDLNPKSIGYKFSEDCEGALSEVLIPPTHPIAKKIIKARNKRLNNDYRFVKYIAQMKERFYEIEFDYDAAFKWIHKNIKQQSKKRHNEFVLKAIRDKQFFFKRNKTNTRLDTNLTNLKSELKQFLIGDYYHIDMKNSQPLLLNYLLMQLFPVIRESTGEFCFENRMVVINKWFTRRLIKAIQKNPIYKSEAFQKERIKFHEWTVNGIFYDEFVKDATGFMTINRKTAKKIIFKIFFADNQWRDKDSLQMTESFPRERMIFRNSFPIIHRLITELKSKDHKKFSVYLQKLEAEIFLDKICKKLVENGIVPLTIHDSFIIDKKDKTKAAQITKEILNEYFLINPKFSPIGISNICNKK